MRGVGVRETFWLRAGVALVWLATGLLVLHPTYRSIGGGYLDRLGLPHWLMPVTCVFEVGLGVWVLLRRAGNLVTLLQLAMVLSFTVILAVFDPWLLVNPFGMLTKNIPILVAVTCAWLVEREGWSRRADWFLRAGMASIWLTEGLLPKVFFQQVEELAIVQAVGLSFGAPGTVLAVIGLSQAASAVLALVLSGRALQIVLAGQILALVVLPLAVSWQLPWLWFHPFGPFTKNVPIICGTGVVLWRCSSRS